MFYFSVFILAFIGTVCPVMISLHHKRAASSSITPWYSYKCPIHGKIPYSGDLNVTF